MSFTILVGSGTQSDPILLESETDDDFYDQLEATIELPASEESESEDMFPDSLPVGARRCDATRYQTPPASFWELEDDLPLVGEWHSKNLPLIM